MERLTVIGCGWFGRPFAAALAARGWQVAGSVRNPRRAEALGADGIAGFALDLDDARFPPEPFADARVLVAVPPARRGEGYPAGMCRLFRHARDAGAAGLIFVSSTSVYRGLSGSLSEADPPQPDRPLSQLERDLSELELASCALRFGGLIGPDRHPGRFLAGRRELPRGGEPVNLVRRSDCIAAASLLVQLPPAEWPPCLNVVAPEHPPRGEYYPEAARALGLDPPTFRDEPPSAQRVVRSAWLAGRGFRFASIRPRLADAGSPA